MTARLRKLRYRSLKGLARDRLDHLKSDLANGDIDPAGRFPEYTFTAANATNELTVAGEDTLAAGNPRVLLYGDDLPLGLEAGTLYWLADAGVNLYTLHPTKGDAAAATNTVVFTDDGTGTQTIVILE